MLATLLTAYRLCRECSGAFDAAEAVINADGTIFAAIDAAAATTEGKAAPEFVAELKDLTRTAINYMDQATTALKAVVDKSSDAAVFLIAVKVRLQALGAGD